MTFEEMRNALNVDYLTPDEADRLRNATSSADFPVENVEWALECIQILEDAIR